jgi:hypothetical protein
LEDDTEAKDALDAFMHYIDNALSEDGVSGQINCTVI